MHESWLIEAERNASELRMTQIMLDVVAAQLDDHQLVPLLRYRQRQIARRVKAYDRAVKMYHGDQ